MPRPRIGLGHVIGSILVDMPPRIPLVAMRD